MKPLDNQEGLPTMGGGGGPISSTTEKRLPEKQCFEPIDTASVENNSLHDSPEPASDNEENIEQPESHNDSNDNNTPEEENLTSNNKNTPSSSEISETKVYLETYNTDDQSAVLDLVDDHDHENIDFMESDFMENNFSSFTDGVFSEFFPSPTNARLSGRNNDIFFNDPVKNEVVTNIETQMQQLLATNSNSTNYFDLQTNSRNSLRANSTFGTPEVAMITGSQSNSSTKRPRSMSCPKSTSAKSKHQLVHTKSSMSTKSRLNRFNKSEQKRKDDTALFNTSKNKSESNKKLKTCMDIFRQYIEVIKNIDGTQSVDASGIISKECYQKWLETRKNSLKNPHLTFVQTIRGHITGDPKVGRNPFDPSTEADLLRLLSQKKTWPCFEGTEAKYGSRGMKLAGFHERKRLVKKARTEGPEFPISNKKIDLPPQPEAVLTTSQFRKLVKSESEKISSNTSSNSISSIDNEFLSDVLKELNNKPKMEVDCKSIVFSESQSPIVSVKSEPNTCSSAKSSVGFGNSSSASTPTHNKSNKISLNEEQEAQNESFFEKWPHLR